MPKELQNKLNNIFQQVKENREMNETKLRRIFDKQGIFELLDYKEDDVSVEANIEGNRADYHCRDEYDNVVVVWEFKNPSKRRLSDYLSQLWDLYVKPLKADYGVLFNGLQIILFKRINSNYDEVFSSNIADLSTTQLEQLLNLEKPDYSTRNLKEIKAYFDKFRAPEDKITLQEETSREHFYKIFRLTKGSVFENLLLQMIELFEKEYESHKKDKFVTSAYDFWRESYARDPEEVPAFWKKFMEQASLKISRKEDLFKFMFCLETSYALFTRLILAKACEDYAFPGIYFSDFIERKVKDFAWREMEISQAAWAVLTKQLIESMRDQLVESIFEEDIFYWWTTAFEKLEEDPYTGTSRETLLFGGAVAKLLFAVYKFDFSKIVGDPLGNLYQRYFDKKTRKALGEFYTPQEVVDYIIDSVDYTGYKILNKRLLDPACGSGTFLVTALNRYLTEAQKRVKDGASWADELKKLCNEYHIVGFDVHPFATVMAQIQFMLVLLPYYKKAMDQEPRFVLKRIPIFRTDSLIDERKSGRIDLESFGKGEVQSIKMPLELPIYSEADEGFLTKEIILPYTDAVIKHEVDIINTEEYFTVIQALFDTVKKDAKNDRYKLDQNAFEVNIKHYLHNKNWRQIVNFITPYGNKILETIENLKYEYGDGRLLKSIEDLILAAILKNYVKYNYVVGNPPYVRIQNLPQQQREFYRSNYQSSYGKFDIFILFIERGVNWLDEEGKLGYITSNQFLNRNYGTKIREYISHKASLQKLVDFGETQVFKDVTAYPCIFVISNENESSSIKFIRVLEPQTNILQIVRQFEGRNEYRDEFVAIFERDRENLTDKWNILEMMNEPILQKMREHNRLGDMIRYVTGVQTGKDRLLCGYINEESVFSPKGINEKYKVESECFSPVVFGRHVKRWKISWNGLQAFWPISSKGNLVLEEKQIMDLFPHTYEYLLKYKESISKRKWFGKTPSELHDSWFAPMFFDTPSKYSKIKILSPSLTAQTNFSIDKTGKLFVLGTAGVVGFIPNSDPEPLLGILNSKAIEFYMKSVCPIKRGGYYQLSKQSLTSFPIPSDFCNFQKRISGKVRKIKKCSDLEQDIITFPNKYLENSYMEINNKVVRSSSSHKAISPKIQKRQDGAYNVIIGKRKTENPIVVDSEEKAQFVQIALNGKDVKKGEKIEIFVPKSNKAVKKIIDEYERDKKKLEEMPSIEGLEEEINEIVYDLYGLDGDDITVIEDFLEKF